MIRVPTGLQDYRPALYGGIAALELRVDGAVRVPLEVSARSPRRAPGRLLHRRAARLGHQQLGDHQAAHRRRRPRDRLLRRHRPGHRRLRAALERGDWPAAGAALAEEWRARMQLAPR